MPLCLRFLLAPLSLLWASPLVSGAVRLCKVLAVNSMEEEWTYASMADWSEPTEKDIQCTEHLDEWLSRNAEIEVPAEQRKKERLLCEITATVRGWVTRTDTPLSVLTLAHTAGHRRVH